MNALLVRTAAEKLGVPTERIFGLSFEWNETPHSKKFIVEQFLRWYYDGITHPIIEDFVIDILAGRVQPIRQLK
ncbi:MAG: hypothetical protein WC055_14680 [Melioribacteraceae bacterium]